MTANTATDGNEAEDATQCRHIEPVQMDGDTVTEHTQCTTPADETFDIEAGYGADASDVPLCEEHRPDDDVPRGDMGQDFPKSEPKDPEHVHLEDYPTTADYLDALSAAEAADTE